MLPQMKSMQDARASSSFDASDLLREIEAAGASRHGHHSAHGAAGGPPPPPPMAAGMRGFVPAPPPPAPEGMFAATTPTSYGSSVSMTDSIRIGAEKRSRTLSKWELACGVWVSSLACGVATGHSGA